jgi:hypothetical protein
MDHRLKTCLTSCVRFDGHRVSVVYQVYCGAKFAKVNKVQTKFRCKQRTRAVPSPVLAHTRSFSSRACRRRPEDYQPSFASPPIETSCFL